MFTAWKVATNEFEAHDNNRLREERQKLYDMKQAVVLSLGDKYFSCGSFEKLASAKALFSHKLQSIADEKPIRPVDSVAHINLINCCCLGARASLIFPQVVEIVQEEARHFPANAITVVIPPNTSAWGRKGDHDKDVQSNVRDLVTKLESDEVGVDVKVCSLMWDMDTMYSPTREGKLDFFVCVSERKDEQGKLKSIFKTSTLYKRRCVPRMVQVLQRCDMTNPTSLISQQLPSNEGMEKKQWCSGSDFYVALIKAAIQGTNLKCTDAAQLRDWTMYDAWPGKAIMELTMMRDKSIPALSYTGASWAYPREESVIIRDNVENSLNMHLFYLITEDKYPLSLETQQAINDLSPRPGIGGRPVLDEKRFELCQPRANGDLPATQTLIDKWSNYKPKAGTKLPDFATVVKDHNAAFNVSGEAWKKRDLGSEEGSQESGAKKPRVGEDAITIPAQDGQLSSKEEVVARGSAHVLPANMFELIVCPEHNELYIFAREDTVLDHTKELCLIRGRYLAGQAARTYMEEGSQYVAWDFADKDDTLVSCQTQPAMAPPFKSDPVPLYQFLNFLEKSGKVRYTLMMHSLEPTQGQAGRYTIKKKDDAVFQVTPPTKDRDINLNSCGSLFDINALRESAYVHVVNKLNYIGAQNQIRSSFPAVYLKKSVKMKKNDCVRVLHVPT